LTRHIYLEQSLGKSVNKPFPNGENTMAQSSMSQDNAEIIALKALGWVMAQGDLSTVFLGATGASENDLRTRSDDPDFLASVLDFITMDDDWIISFCTGEGLPFDAPMIARMTLPGGAPVHWT
jgi:hypothetical protein